MIDARVGPSFWHFDLGGDTSVLLQEIWKMASAEEFEGFVSSEFEGGLAVAARRHEDAL